ncbi:MAG: hypothetical protein ACKOCD_00115, partial [Nitrospiraceae bacterium]
RQASIRLKPNEGEVSLEPAVREALVRLLGSYFGALASSEDEPQWKAWLRQGVDDEVLVHSLASDLDLTPFDKQFVLEANSLQQRARRLHDLLEFKLQERGGVKGWG